VRENRCQGDDDRARAVVPALPDAQRDKLDLICRKLGLRPGMRLLDVGCGWASLLIHAATHYGVTAVGVTLSAEQRALGLARVAKLGLTDRVEIRLQDYREITDRPFDAVSSVEMGEHVGQDNYPVYAAQLHTLLLPQGRLLLQQMSRGAAGSNTAPGRRRVHGALRRAGHVHAPARRDAELPGGGRARGRRRPLVARALRRDRAAVADTLQDSRSEAIRLIGEEQYRVWLLHLAGAALAFEENRMGVHQILMVRPDADGRSGLPRGRAVTLGADPALDRIAADVTQDEVDGAPRVHSGSDTMTGVAHPWGAFLTNLWVSAVVILVVMLGALGVAVLRKRHDGIDAVWGGGFAIVAITTLILSAGAGDAWRRWLITALTVVWGARLAWHIGRRNHGRPEDERYVALMARARATPTSARSVGSTCPRLRRCGSCPCRSSWASTGSRRPRPASSPRSSAWPCGWSGSSSRRSATRSSPGSPRTRTTRARSWARACGATPATPTTSATRSSGGVSQSSRCTTPPG
jgi:cyclopropane fatty-acyl-phospholipid synthase-like methyltransferase